MNIDGDIIEFKTDLKFFETEKSGNKNNTVRVVTKEEKELIHTFFKDTLPRPIFIHIVNTELDEGFYREIKNISFLEDPRLDFPIAIFTWEMEIPVCCVKCGKPVTPDIQIACSMDEYGEPVCTECE